MHTFVQNPLNCSGDGLHSSVKVLAATEVHAENWVRW